MSSPTSDAGCRTPGRRPSDDRTPDFGRCVSASSWHPTLGAVPDGNGVTFRVWASAARTVTLQIEASERTPARRLRLQPIGDGVFEARVNEAKPGMLYRYLADDKGPFPDPASRFQPLGVHAASEVIDPTTYLWHDASWRGVRMEDLVIYELHVGTFSPRGTFSGAIDRLPYLVDLGVTAIELMPLAAFPGLRNWGYDGAALFAPACQYGPPDDLRRLVDAAHAAGLAVLLDVVYNHLGPDGAYLAVFSPDFFSPHHTSPWGAGVNLDRPGSAMVRRFLIENALHWISEYHLDGLRLDATHAMADDGPRPFLAELAGTLHALAVGRPLHVIAEDERNLATIVRPPSEDGWGLDAVWADDFHHQVHRALTHEREGYYVDYSGSAEDIAATVDRGWFHVGQHSTFAPRRWGSDPRGVPLPRFVFCLQNHDQVGNRAFGERLNHLADLAACRAAAALLLLAPETPLLFMGQEWAASTPFLYFTDHGDELGRLVTAGRRREFETFSAFSDPEALTRIPDPQSEATFQASRLNWDEIDREPHASMLRLYRALIALRPRVEASTGEARREPALARTLDEATVCIGRRTDSGRLLVIARLAGAGRVGLPVSSAGQGVGLAASDVVLTTEDAPFAPDGAPPRIAATGSSVEIEFARPSAVVFRRR